MLAVTDFHLCILQGLNNRNKQNIVQIFVQVKLKLNLEIWCVWGGSCTCYILTFLLFIDKNLNFWDRRGKHSQNESSR